MSLIWRGEAVFAKTLAATKAAVDLTTMEAADDARQSHWWTSRTGQLEENIVTEPATVDEHGVVGRFGCTRGDGFYGLFLERQTPFLRPASDRAFPNLAARIRNL